MKATILNDHEPKTYALIFDKGDEVVKELTAFAKEHQLAAAHFTAIGAFSQVTLGYFDRARKDYTKIPVREQVEVLSLVGEIRPAVLCVGALSSSGQASHTRYLCKRLRARFPNLRIVVGHWGLAQGESAQVRAELEAAGADYTGITFMETRQHLQLIDSFDAPPISDREPSLPAVGRCQ